jgi:hypothetical protein
MFPKTKKILMILLVSFEILALNIYPVSADLFSGISSMFSGSSSGGFGSPTSMMKEIEKRYNLNPDSMKSFGQEMNVSENKGVAPGVQTFFTPADPKPGEEVTATAMATGYQNDKSKLVYVWYLARKGTYEKIEDKSDDEIDKIVNGWKIEAMRRIVNNGFRADRVDWTHVNKSSTEIKKDGFNLENVFGGVSAQYIKNGDPTSNQHIYMHDYQTGKNYELSNGDNQLVSDIGHPTCAVAEMKPYCVKTGSYLSPEGIYGTGGGEGGPGGGGGDGGSSTGGGGGGGGAGGGGGGGGYGTTMQAGGQCLDSGSDATCDTDQICPNNYIAICLRGDMPASGIVCRATRCGILNGSQTKWSYTASLLGGDIERTEEDCTDESGEHVLVEGVDYSAQVTCSTSGNADQNDFHLFPHYDSDYAPKGYSCPSISGEKVGDGKFTKAEECFWGSNPYDPGTSNNQVNDEAVASGVGQDKLTWIYQPGDKLGVVTEGTSFFPTKYEDASNMVMMGMTNNSCIENNDIVSPPSQPGGPSPLQAKVESIKGYNVQIPTINFGKKEMNKCLIKNLVDPTQGGQGGKINVKLSYSPDNPINGQPDSNGNVTRGDLVILRTSLEDSNRNESELYYKYTIYGASEVKDSADQPGVGAPPSIDSYTTPGNGWHDVTSDLAKSSNITSSPSAAYFEGIGLSSVKFRLNEAVAGRKYLLAVVEVFEGNRTNELNAGSSGAIITLNNSGANLQVNLASSSNGNTLGNGEQICVNNASGMCEVIPGQVIQVKAGNTSSGGINMQNYQWTLNGKTINCSNAMGTGCGNASGTEQGGTIYFPVNGSPGDVITLTMNANDINPNNNDYVAGNNTGLATNITKQFIVVEPTVKIQADGTSAWSAILGQYYPDSNDPNACTRREETGTGPRETNVCVNTSQSVFGTNAGSSVTLKAEYSPLWLDDLVTSNPDMFDIRWVVDGQEVAGSAKSVTFTAGADGAVHNVSVSVMFKQDVGTRQAAAKFGSSSAEQYFSDSVQVDVFGGSAMSQAGPRKYFASLISNIPSQTVFMIRIALTIFVIILVSNILSSGSYFGRNYAFQNKKKR